MSEEIVQGSPEWFAQRCGKATASRISDIVAKTKTGYSTSRANYMAQLVVERMTNQVGESYSNAAMEWGVEGIHGVDGGGECGHGLGSLLKRIGLWVPLATNDRLRCNPLVDFRLCQCKGFLDVLLVGFA